MVLKKVKSQLKLHFLDFRDRNDFSTRIKTFENEIIYPRRMLHGLLESFTESEKLFWLNRDRFVFSLAHPDKKSDYYAEVIDPNFTYENLLDLCSHFNYDLALRDASRLCSLYYVDLATKENEIISVVFPKSYCQSCALYDGKHYYGNWLNCAVHPYGIKKIPCQERMVKTESIEQDELLMQEQLTFKDVALFLANLLLDKIAQNNRETVYLTKVYLFFILSILLFLAGGIYFDFFTFPVTEQSILNLLLRGVPILLLAKLAFIFVDMMRQIILGDFKLDSSLLSLYLLFGCDFLILFLIS